jgi:hypothetical protein
LLSSLSVVSDVFSGYLLSGESMPGSAGVGFTPHVVHVAIGEVSYFFISNLGLSSVLDLYVV